VHHATITLTVQRVWVLNLINCWQTQNVMHRKIQFSYCFWQQFSLLSYLWEPGTRHEPVSKAYRPSGLESWESLTRHYIYFFIENVFWPCNE